MKSTNTRTRSPSAKQDVDIAILWVTLLAAPVCLWERAESERARRTLARERERRCVRESQGVAVGPVRGGHLASPSSRPCYTCPNPALVASGPKFGIWETPGEGEMSKPRIAFPDPSNRETAGPGRGDSSVTNVRLAFAEAGKIGCDLT